MPKTVDVPAGIFSPQAETVEFPDSMSNDDISRAIRLHTPEPAQKGSQEWVNWRNQRLSDLTDHATSGQQPEDKGWMKMLWDKVNPFAVVTAPGAGGGDQPGQGPIGKVIGGVVKAGADQASKAVAAATSGDYLSAAGHGAAAALPVLGPMAANFGEHAGTAIGAAMGGNPDPNATKEAVTDALAALVPVGAAKGARALSSVAPGLEAGMRSNAEEQYARVLNPTTKANKFTTAAVVPELIDRGVTARTMKGLQAQAQSHIGALGAAIGDAWDNLPAGTSTELAPVYDRLQSAIDNTHSVADSSGKMIPKGPEAARAIGNIQQLQQTLMDVAETDPTTGKLTIPVDKVRGLKQYFDDIAAKAGRYQGNDLADASTAEAHGIAADSIREELAKDHPDIDKLNKEYSFWKNVNGVVSDTIQRRQGQAPPLGARLAQGAGFIKGGVVGAEAMKALTEAVRSPAWGTVSAVMKDRLADSLARGGSLQANSAIYQIRRAVAAKALTGQPQQTAEPAAISGQ